MVIAFVIFLVSLLLTSFAFIIVPHIYPKSFYAFKYIYLGITFIYLTYLIIGIIVIFTSPRINYIKEYNIVSLERDKATEGFFVLGNGSIDSEVYYFAYREKGYNTYKLVKLKASNTDIVEREDLKDRGEVYQVRLQGPGILKIFFIDQGYSVYVPKGTIIRKFSL